MKNLLYACSISAAAFIGNSQAFAQASPCVTPANGTCTLVNDATLLGLDGQIEIDVPTASANIVSLTNNGSVTGYVTVYADDTDNLSDVLSQFTSINNGSIIGTLYGDPSWDLSAQHRNASITNNGSVTSIAPQSGILSGYSLVGLSNEAPGATTLTFTNTGLIETNRYGSGAVAIGSAPESALDPASPVVNITNSGKISATGGALFHINPIFRPTGAYSGTFSSEIEVAAALAAGAASSVGAGTMGGTVNVTNAASGQIIGGGALRLGSLFGILSGPFNSITTAGNGALVTTAPADVGTVALAVYGSSVSIRNDGLIQGGVGTDLTGLSNISYRIPDIESAYFNDADFNNVPVFTFPDKYLAGAIHSFANGTDVLTNSATGRIIGSVDLGGGNDSITNLGSITGNVFLRDGDDRYVLGINAVQMGAVDGGMGNDTALIDISAGGTLSSTVYQPFVNFENFGVTGTGTVAFTGTLPFQTLRLEGSMQVAAGSTVKTLGPIAITGGTGADSLVVAGTVDGDIDLGAGADQFNIASTGVVTGTIFGGADADNITLSGTAAAIDLGAGDDLVTIMPGGQYASIAGGLGTDTVAITSNGTDAAPQDLSLPNLTGIEVTRLNSGTVALTGGYATPTLNVAGGRFIGKQSSILTTSQINVSSGATFGSAGTVVGNINVSGTLSPGASPGTMTVNGNVALASGSVTLFELSPTVNDLLLISGTLSIASGSTLTLTGARPLSPGSALDLIVADGGITGSFTTINRPVSIFGFVAQRGNRIQLLGQFLVDAGLGSQQAATINYVNSVLIAGQASPALLGALPALLNTNGSTNNSAFALLNAESYASASQIGAENGLTIAKAMRSLSVSSRKGEGGLFTFAQGVGNWRKLRGNTAAGISPARINSQGIIGGIGYGSEMASVSAITGYLDSDQSVNALAANTNARGIVYGLTGQVNTGGFSAIATLALNNAKTDTQRALPAAGTAKSSYRLKSTLADLQLSYRVPLGEAWAVSPTIGLSHISTKRTGAIETGSAAFALDIAAQTDKATFADASLRFEGGRGEGDAFRPYLATGIRKQIGGNEIRSASASFVGGSTGLQAFGAGRADLTYTANAGFSYNVSDNVQLYSSYEGEFRKSGSGHFLTGGIRLAF